MLIHILILVNGCSNAPALDQTQHNSDNGDNQQHMNDIAEPETIEAQQADQPKDNENNGNCVK
ncbi:hypothetical protein GCM10023189_48810 [Nibrella saemangeumensis]|uniref:Secreted protein n=1 Tax=Nibrella saemangeumensis TaxID=1084526 RepID=A0ABP8NJM9_9BACT